jgi:hypothetical protein
MHPIAKQKQVKIYCAVITTYVFYMFVVKVQIHGMASLSPRSGPVSGGWVVTLCARAVCGTVLAEADNFMTATIEG